MDGLEEIDLRIDEHEESGSRRQIVAVFERLRTRAAVHERR